MVRVSRITINPLGTQSLLLWISKKKSRLLRRNRRARDVSEFSKLVTFQYQQPPLRGWNPADSAARNPNQLVNQIINQNHANFKMSCLGNADLKQAGNVCHVPWQDSNPNTKTTRSVEKVPLDMKLVSHNTEIHTNRHTWHIIFFNPGLYKRTWCLSPLFLNYWLLNTNWHEEQIQFWTIEHFAGIILYS